MVAHRIESPRHDGENRREPFGMIVALKWHIIDSKPRRTYHILSMMSTGSTRYYLGYYFRSNVKTSENIYPIDPTLTHAHSHPYVNRFIFAMQYSCH